MSLIRRLSQGSAKVALTVAIGSGSVAAFQLVSVKDEIAIGQQAQQELRRETPQVGDQRVRAFVSDLGTTLAQHAPGAQYPYSFSTADYAELNAFALPGGPVWVHRGILAASESEAQVAGVIAHEIAHIAERHAARQITKGTVANGLLGLLGAMLGNEGAGAAAAQVAAGVTANSVMLKFSRDDERAADRVGVAIMARAGYDTRGLVEFMRVLAAQQGRAPGSVAQFLSTHPAPESRVRDLQQLVAANPGGRRRTSAQFTDVKRRLAQLPAARRMPRT